MSSSHARRHSSSCIPTKNEAQQREERLKLFHQRRYHVKRNSLENVYRQNYRLFVNIHQQESSYQDLFEDAKSPAAQRKSLRYKQLLHQLPKPENIEGLQIELKKLKRHRTARYYAQKNQSNVTCKSKVPLGEKSLNVAQDFIHS